MDKVFLTNKDMLEMVHKAEHELYEYEKYIPVREGINGECTVAIYDIPPLKSNYPYHYHGQDIEIFYIIEGCGVLEEPDGTRIIKKGDIIICPPNKQGAHKLTNTSKTNKLSYIEFDTIHKPEVVKYPHSNKVGILHMESVNTFYSENNTMDYYEGE